MGTLKNNIIDQKNQSHPTSREDLRRVLIDSMHVVSSEELRARRNPLYQYMI